MYLYVDVSVCTYIYAVVCLSASVYVSVNASVNVGVNVSVWSCECMYLPMFHVTPNGPTKIPLTALHKYHSSSLHHPTF